MLLLYGCTGQDAVQVMAPTSIQEYKIVATPKVVYQRLYTRMNLCRTVHNLFMAGDLVGGMDPDGAHGRLYVAKYGRTLWGARIEPIPEGTKIITQIGPDAPSDRFHVLMRTWADGKRPPSTGYSEC